MWDLLQNEDEAMIADSVREFLQSELPLERLRPRGALPVDSARVRVGMVELGWFGGGLTLCYGAFRHCRMMLREGHLSANRAS